MISVIFKRNLKGIARESSSIQGFKLCKFFFQVAEIGLNREVIAGCPWKKNNWVDKRFY